MDPQGKVALVTGGGVRVGRAISLGLAGAGAHLVVHYNRSAAAACQTVEDARALGVEASAIQSDLSDPEAARTVVAAACERFGGVDILVHAASPFHRISLLDVNLEMWRGITAVIAESFFLLVQALAPVMRQRGAGAIVPILDRGAFDPWPEYGAHGVAKATLWAVARTLAVELAPQIRVNAVVPGPVLPPPQALAHATADWVQRMEAAAEGTLLGRWGTPQDVVDAVLYLVTAEYVVGEVLFADGGERWAHRRPANR